MGNVYNILLIGDEENNISLIEAELSKLNIQFQVDIIHKEEQLIDRLEKNRFDNQ